MAQQKFFSGLTEGMINRSAGERPDRQKSQFFWPDDYLQDDSGRKDEGRPKAGGRAVAPVQPQSNGNRQGGGAEQQQAGAGGSVAPPSARTTINGRLFGLHAGADEVDDKVTHGGRSGAGNGQTVVPSREDRLLKSTASHIQFFDGVESSFGELERSKAHERRRIEQFLRQQSEEDTGEGARNKRISTMQSNIQFYDYPAPPTTARHSALSYHAAGSRSVASDTQLTSAIGRHEQLLDCVEPDIDETPYQDDDFEFDDRSSVRSSVCSSSYAPSGYGRTSNAGVREHHKRDSQRHLRSSINFHDGCSVADDREATTRKPMSVRESATNRVGVGLPNL